MKCFSFVSHNLAIAIFGIVYTKYAKAFFIRFSLALYQLDKNVRSCSSTFLFIYFCRLYIINKVSSLVPMLLFRCCYCIRSSWYYLAHKNQTIRLHKHIYFTKGGKNDKQYGYGTTSQISTTK